MLKMNFFPVCLFRIGKVINWRAKSKGLRLDSSQTIFSFASRWWKKEQHLSLLKTEFKTYTVGSWGITTIVNNKRILRWNIQNQHTSLKWGAKIGCMKPDNAPPITEEKPEYKKRKGFFPSRYQRLRLKNYRFGKELLNETLKQRAPRVSARN